MNPSDLLLADTPYPKHSKFAASNLEKILTKTEYHIHHAKIQRHQQTKEFS